MRVKIDLQAPPPHFQNNVSESDWAERIQEINSKANIKTGVFTRWSTSWWNVSHRTLSDSINNVNGYVIIGFKNPNDLSGVDEKGKILIEAENLHKGIEVIKNLGISHINEIEKIPAISAKMEANPQLIEKIRNHPFIDYVEPDGNTKSLSSALITNFEYELQNQDIPWNVARIQAPEVWNRTTGIGVDIHIIDTGVTNVLDLNPVTRYTNDGDLDDFREGDGHGTLIAGITSALDNNIDQVGIAFDSDLWSGRYPEDVNQRISFITDAIGFARSNDTFVINLSFAIGQNSALTDQINGAYNIDGLIIVAGSGDTQVSNNVLYPARINSVIAVASTDFNNNQSAFSPTGPEIEISAPGEVIVSTSRNGGLSGLIQGTSFAVPHVVGAVALIKSYNPTWTNIEIRQILNESALHLGNSNIFGSGLVQVHEAIRIRVTMSGPNTYSSAGNYTWTTSVQKDDGPVSYSWHKKSIGYTNWQLVGSNSSLSLNLAPTDGSFQLRVTVNDGFDTNETIKMVDYVNDGDDCPPFEICID